MIPHVRKRKHRAPGQPPDSVVEYLRSRPRLSGMAIDLIRMTLREAEGDVEKATHDLIMSPASCQHAGFHIGGIADAIALADWVKAERAALVRMGVL